MLKSFLTVPKASSLSVTRRFYSSPVSSRFLNDFMTTQEKGPVQLSIEQKVTESLEPKTHFKVTVVSDKFQGKTLMQRHRLIYSLLDDELKQGLHALTLKTKTQKEIDAQK
ncbi:unnamed protein product [Cunninghamella blakesleeana]